jgi:hypothetical protein
MQAPVELMGNEASRVLKSGVDEHFLLSSDAGELGSELGAVAAPGACRAKPGVSTGFGRIE